MKKRYTFRLGTSPSTGDLIVEAESVSEALGLANTYFGYIPGFYAWYGSPNENSGPDFRALYGTWD